MARIFAITVATPSKRHVNGMLMRPFAGSQTTQIASEVASIILQVRSSLPLRKSEVEDCSAAGLPAH